MQAKGTLVETDVWGRRLDTQGACGICNCGVGACCNNRDYTDHCTCAARGNACCYDKNRMVYPLFNCNQCGGVFCEIAQGSAVAAQPGTQEKCGRGGGQCGRGGCCFNAKLADHYVCAGAGNACCYKDGNVWPMAKCKQCGRGAVCEKAGSSFLQEPGEDAAADVEGEMEEEPSHTEEDAAADVGEEDEEDDVAPKV
jgi:hypothetical protein